MSEKKAEEKKVPTWKAMLVRNADKTIYALKTGTGDNPEIIDHHRDRFTVFISDSLYESVSELWKKKAVQGGTVKVSGEDYKTAELLPPCKTCDDLREVPDPDKEHMGGGKPCPQCQPKEEN